MKFLYLFLLCLFSMNALAQYKKAFLLGIGDYPQALGWTKLHGNEDAEKIKKLLIDRGSFSENNIKIITEQAATHDNVLKELDAFVSNLKTGDTVVFYYSGHGQRVSDIDGDERNEDNLDEAFIMYNTPLEASDADPAYRLENHLLDDELGVRYDSIRSKIGKDGFLFVMIDACFSGFSLKGTDFELVDKGTYKSYIIDDINPLTTNSDSISLSELVQKNNEFAPVLMLTASTNTVAKEIKDYNSGALTLSFIDIMNNESLVTNNQLAGKIRDAYDRYRISTDINPWIYGANDDAFFLFKNKINLFPKEPVSFFTHSFPSSNKKDIAKLFPYGTLHGMTEGSILQAVNRTTGKIESYAKVVHSSLLQSYIVFDNEHNISKNYELQSQCAFVPYVIAPINSFKISINTKEQKDLYKQIPSLEDFLGKLLTNEAVEYALSFDKKSNNLTLKNGATILFNDTSVTELMKIITPISFQKDVQQIAIATNDFPLELYQSINSNQYCTRNNVTNTSQFIYPIIINNDDGQFAQIAPNNYTNAQDMLAKGFNEYSIAYDMALPKKQLIVISQAFDGEYNKKNNLLLTPIAPLGLEKSVFNKNIHNLHYWHQLDGVTFPSVDNSRLKPLADNNTKISIINLKYEGDECLSFPPNEACRKLGINLK